MRPRLTAYCAALATVALVATACGGTPDAPPTVKVDRGTVATSVAAAGTLVAVNEQNLGFDARGKLAELFVKVGDRVAAGQKLARLDDAALKQALKSAQAKLDQQTASLRKVTGGNSVESAQADLDTARSVLEATKDSAAATDDADSSATDRARVQLGFDQNAVDKAKRQRDSCLRGTGSASTSRQKLTEGSRASTSTAGSGSTGPTATATAAPASTAPSAPDCTAAETAVDTARRTALASQTALDAATHRQSTDAAQGRLSIENARKSVVAAQNTLDGAGRDKPADTAIQQAMVNDARTAVDGAQRDLAAAVLTAPVAGTVSAVNGSIGEFLPAAGGATPLAPGSTARIPAAAASSGSTGGAATASSGGAFITLNDVATFQLVVPFEESDAAQVAAGQRVDVSVDAVPGLTEPGTVVAVAPSAESINGVTSYYTTVVLNGSDPRLKDGQTAQADVLTKSVDNVLRVPSPTVRQDGGRSVVDVPDAEGKPVPTPFTPGLVGSRFTEVVSGLTEGTDVLLPQAQVTATPQRRNGG